MYIEPDPGLKKAVERAAAEFSDQGLASEEERNLIGNAMRRALQVILKYQKDHEVIK